ncbi:DUF6705 family protein [Chryseobacterium aurantiacum]|uniref:DUF6705 family protein n=1 Tax=Chryseobacterium aurantiacum TaxID=2116499 RepID=UPI000D130DD2|nr:DUF6705 family protein [Chryseobacterium aurantiacum]
MNYKYLIILFFVGIINNAQTLPLRTYTDIPENAYLKDTNNELQYYEGTWKGTWDNKTVFITFKKVTNQYNDNLKYFKDYIIGKFKVVDNNGIILFDNTNVTDNFAKIRGSRIRKIDDKYSLIYNDFDLCNTSGNIIINFIDTSKTQLTWKMAYGSNMITIECPYYNTQVPEALPKDIILTKQ